MPKVQSSLWLARHVGLHFLATLALFTAVWDRPLLFLLLSSVLAISALFLAWRAADYAVGKAWWAGLVFAIGLFYALCNAVAQTSGSEEKQCPPRYRQPAMWTRAVDVGPDSNCQVRGPAARSGNSL